MTSTPCTCVDPGRVQNSVFFGSLAQYRVAVLHFLLLDRAPVPLQSDHGRNIAFDNSWFRVEPVVHKSHLAKSRPPGAGVHAPNHATVRFEPDICPELSQEVSPTS